MKRLLKKYKKMKKSRLGRDSNLCLPDTSWAFYLLDNEETSSRFFVPVKEFDHNYTKQNTFWPAVDKKWRNDGSLQINRITIEESLEKGHCHLSIIFAC